MTTERKLTREEVELLVNGYANHIPNSEVERLAASWLEQNAALEQIRDLHDPRNPYGVAQEIARSVLP